MKKHTILFVCLGNICRSPMAEYVLRHLAEQNGIAQYIETASAGTSGWHDGENMHKGTAQMLSAHGISPKGFTSRKITRSDFSRYDLLICMDDNNLAELERLFGKQPERIFKLTELIPESGYTHVPDPWYTGDFAETYRLCEAACTALLAKLAPPAPPSR